ncbi:uncharacterized protein RMCB_0376 [Mycolicibacterium brisbanense]|uniref:Uncharacterized protein n=3 Tax=Mycolicibacterium brisbanense TaxID=146020 RepID=A0A117I434_9MYCO|nr:uncharacterized protein RMCB_0376 [Mycolicibacterium brisbanense]
MNEVAPPMKLKRTFAKAAIAGGLGIAALGLSAGIGHAAPTSQDLSTTTFVQGWGWGHHGWGPGWGQPWYWGPPPPPPPPPWGYPGYGYAGWGGGWGC